jgi:hypothetical protein
VVAGTLAKEGPVVTVGGRERYPAIEAGASDAGKEPEDLPAARAGHAPVHVAVEAGLLDHVAVLDKARKHTGDLPIEGRASFPVVKAHI